MSETWRKSMYKQKHNRSCVKSRTCSTFKLVFFFPFFKITNEDRNDETYTYIHMSKNCRLWLHGCGCMVGRGEGGGVKLINRGKVCDKRQSLTPLRQGIHFFFCIQGNLVHDASLKTKWVQTKAYGLKVVTDYARVQQGRTADCFLFVTEFGFVTLYAKWDLIRYWS